MARTKPRGPRIPTRTKKPDHKKDRVDHVGDQPEPEAGVVGRVGECGAGDGGCRGEGGVGEARGATSPRRGTGLVE